ncbi:MAG: ribonuclease P protein component [Candidatus Levybacteria bacterium]|nr:ribonuclease P protein component [Candidatus Levybacteria bacterium]MSU26135.1 ribonuclease P protein component [Candidatus Levybacteria bacterium]
MLKIVNRLIRPVPYTAKTVFSPLFSLRYLKNKLSYNRINVIVSKKVSKKAVLRNKIKRIMLLHLHPDQSLIREGIDMTFIIKQLSLGKNSIEIGAEIDLIFKKEGILK